MSGTAAKTTRREIRKAFGPAALEQVARHDQAIFMVQHQLGAWADGVAGLEQRMNTLEDPPPATSGSDQGVITRRLWDRHVALDNRVYRLESLSFFGRLRWLVWGK
jgi:hypothetical protein